MGSTIHCAAGDATGIIVAAALTGYFGLSMGVDIWIEYAAGFAFGLFIFQALFMKDMMGLSYGEAVRKSFLPEWMSMNAMMAGMLPTMVLLMTRDMRAMEATSPWFWASMSAATLVGVAVAYPVNWWLVKHQLKHGMGTEKALGKGGATAATEHQHAGMAVAGMTHAMPPMTASAHDGHAMPGMSMASDGQVSAGRKALVTVLTLLLLAAGYYVAARYGYLTMRPGVPMEAMPGMDMPSHRM